MEQVVCQQLRALLPALLELLLNLSPRSFLLWILTLLLKPSKVRLEVGKELWY